jgi:hypothetical protein
MRHATPSDSRNSHPDHVGTCICTVASGSDQALHEATETSELGNQVRQSSLREKQVPALGGRVNAGGQPLLCLHNKVLSQ